MLQKFTKKLSFGEKRLLYITIGVVVLALFERVILGQFLSQIEVLENEIEQEKVAIELDLKFLSYKDQIDKKNEAYSKYFVETKQDEYDINAKFLSMVNKLATQAEVNIVKSNPTQTIDQKDYTEYHASLDCTGALEDMLTFMHKINSSDELLKVTKFNMAPRRGTDEMNSSMTVVKLIMKP